MDSIVAKCVTGHGGNSPGNGPFMDVTLKVSDGVISDASYQTYQCPAANDCGKAVCALVKGRSIEQARAVDYGMVAARVGPLPRPKTLCYGLAVMALTDALAQLEKQ